MTLILLYALTLFLGLSIGSFLNVVIYRLEKEENYLWGRSYCPHCKRTLNWKDLVPVFSFLILLGRCRHCHKKISWQYPLVEILTGLIFLLIFNHSAELFTLALGQNSQNFENFGFQLLNLLFLFYISSVLIVIFVYDLKHYIIPDKVLFPAIVITFLYQLILNPKSYILNPILSGIGASLFFLLIFLISGGSWIGFGDVKLAVLLGLILGFPNVLVGLFLAFLFGAIIGLLLMIFRKKGLKSEVPFAPFLITGTFLAMLFGKEIIAWYLSFL